MMTKAQEVELVPRRSSVLNADARSSKALALRVLM